MPLDNRILDHFQTSAQTILASADMLVPRIEQVARLMVHTLTQGGKILACGNGGSAASVQHFSAAMVNRFEQERPGLAVIALTTDIATLSSIANDNAYEQAFARQVKTLGQANDILLVVSTSGHSPSILQAVSAAHARSMPVVALTGRSGGGLTERIQEDDVFLCVPAESAARIQEVHLLIIHCLCDAIDSVLLGVEE